MSSQDFFFLWDALAENSKTLLWPGCHFKVKSLFRPCPFMTYRWWYSLWGLWKAIL